MKKILIGLGLCVFLTLLACEKPTTMSAADLMALDSSFSDYSKMYGYAAAQKKYAHKDEVGLYPNQPPAFGQQIMANNLADWPSWLTVTWSPTDGEISKSADLGYTWGTFTILGVSPEGEAIKDEGKYVTVWKKQTDGSWLSVLNSGSLNGLSLPPPGTETNEQK